MLFNSIDFALFMPIVFFLYWFGTNSNIKYQNFLIVTASYLFYGWWDWRFLFLIFFSTIIDYLVGFGLSKQENLSKRKFLLWISITVNIGFLGLFKYYNFFLENFKIAFSFFGREIQIDSLNIILPIGISFYTFQTLSYSIDVYKRKLKPTKDFISFSAFVSFFPQLVAGPIERATNLLPQFQNKREFDYSKAVDGMKQILWGLFKKIVIADNCAVYANLVFNNSSEYSGSTLALGAIFFMFQIYADFSGYSDIAIGTARLFGFNLMRNFAFPYFSRDLAEFWKRWHISLTTWFRDYLFIPLVKFWRINAWTKTVNVIILFIVTGLWHGANWTFIIWGILNAIFFLPTVYIRKKYNRTEIVAKGKFIPTINEAFNIIKTFCLVTFLTIFFRAENLDHAANFVVSIFSPALFSLPRHVFGAYGLFTLILTCIFMIVEWIGRDGEYAIEKIGIKWKKSHRYLLYYTVVFLILFYGGKEQQFIYFQF